LTQTVKDDGTSSVTVTVHMNSPNAFVGTGGGDVFDFNASGVALSDITIDPHSPGLGKTGSSGSAGIHADGTGNFDFAITCPTCNGGSDAFTGDIVFTVADATINDLVRANSPQGQYFAADIISCDGSGGACSGITGGTGKTGYVDVSAPTS